MTVRCAMRGGRGAGPAAASAPRLVPLLLARLLLAASLAGPAAAAADQRDPRLEALFTALSEAPDPESALGIEAAIWRVWLDGGDSALNGLMGEGVAAMNANRLRDAVGRFTDLALAAPAFAEAWNKRATVYYLMDRLEDSVRDIERTLALEPRHFGAISGLGLIFLRRGDEEGALEAFEKVLEIHPHARGAQFHVQRLRERLRGRRVRARGSRSPQPAAARARGAGGSLSGASFTAGVRSNREARDGRRAGAGQVLQAFHQLTFHQLRESESNGRTRHRATWTLRSRSGARRLLLVPVRTVRPPAVL